MVDSCSRTTTRENDLQDSHTALSLWESFYVIVGSSGAALTGLQFVVIALIAESDIRKETQGIDAFGTPTIVHFCTVLLLSAILSAPWHVLSNVAVMVAAIGVAGLVYGAIVMRRARGQDIYKPVLEDWLWHAIFPITAHIGLVGSAAALFLGKVDALFPIGAISLFLLFIGIHNAWDSVVYIVVGTPPKPDNKT
ncbi:MAG: hypothetical protein ACJ8AJ_07010 [Gemmatimonadaceae bacterium]